MTGWVFICEHAISCAAMFASVVFFARGDITNGFLAIIFSRIMVMSR